MPIVREQLSRRSSMAQDLERISQVMKNMRHPAVRPDKVPEGNVYGHSSVHTEDLGCLCATAPYKAAYRGLMGCFKGPKKSDQKGTSSASMGVSAQADLAAAAPDAAAP